MKKRPFAKPDYEAKGIDPDCLSVKEASLLLGIFYEGILRYVHELEAAGTVSVRRERGQIWLNAEAIETIRTRRLERRSPGERLREEPSRARLIVQARQLQAAADSVRERADALVGSLEKPGPSATWIASLPIVGARLLSHLPVLIEPDETTRGSYVATGSDLGLEAQGRTRAEAVKALRQRIAAEYAYLLQKPRNEEEEERLQELLRYIQPVQAPSSAPKPPASRRVPAHPQAEELAAFWKNQGLPTGAANALGNAGIGSIEDLRKAKWETGLKLPNLGGIGRKRVEAFLSSQRASGPGPE